MKTNRSKPEHNSHAALGVAGIVRPEFVAQNSSLKAYQAEDPAAAPYRTEMFDGRPHVVFPAVIAVEGVMNDAFVSADELAKSAPAWNGRPIPLLHPEELGEPISVAASPEVLERRVGTVFGAHVDGGRLKCELWIDQQKMDRFGASNVLSAMQSGEIVEVSTGYFSDDVLEQSEYRGEPYTIRHINLRPDHLALLPGQIGACSIADGCGVPRINRSDDERGGLSVKVNEALEVLRKAIGVHTNGCNCEACTMKVTRDQIRKDLEALGIVANGKVDASKHSKFVASVDKTLGLKTNEGLGSKHLKMLEELDERGLELMGAMIEAYRATGASNQEPPAADPDDDPDAAAAATGDGAPNTQRRKNGDGTVTINQSELDKMIANAVAKAVETQVPEQTRRTEVVGKLKAHADRNPLTEDDMKTLPVESLERIEKSLRPADYSGQGGHWPNINADEDLDDDEPISVIVNRTLEERRAARNGGRAA